MGFQDQVAGFLGGLVDKEEIVRETLQSTLQNVAKELGCDHKGLWIMIKPCDEEYDFKCYIYQVPEGKPPQFIREITLKEVLGIKQ